MRAVIAAIVLAASMWAQEQKPASPQDEIRKIQTFLFADQGTRGEGFPAVNARHDAQFERIEALVSADLITQIQATPDLKATDLRKRLVDLLGGRYSGSLSPDDPFPFVLRTGPLFGRAGPSVFSVVYDGLAWNGFDGSRIVVESYVLDQGKARLAGRLGREIDGVAGEVQPVDPDELLIQGVVTWSSDASLPHKAALYRINQSGVSLIWASGALPGLEATVFGEHLLVNYRDDKAMAPVGRWIWALDVYTLENQTPSVVLHELRSW